MMAAENTQWTQWIVGTALAVFGLVGGLLRYFSSILRREITDMRQDMDDRTERAQRDREAIWDQIRRQVEDYQKFRGDILLTMFSKADAGAMEARILAAVAVRRDNLRGGD